VKLWLPPLALLALAACGNAAEVEPREAASRPAGSVLSSADGGLEGQTGAEQRPTAFVLAPEGVPLTRVATEWAGRWEKASGLDIGVGDGGIPVTFAEHLFFADHDGVTQEVCGLTTQRFYDDRVSEWYEVVSIEINTAPLPGCPTWGYSVGHEIGHALVGPAVPHAAGGIFSNPLKRGQTYKIDESTLTDVCSHAPCQSFTPE
jgi:hypothetical protein